MSSRRNPSLTQQSKFIKKRLCKSRRTSTVSPTESFVLEMRSPCLSRRKDIDFSLSLGDIFKAAKRMKTSYGYGNRPLTQSEVKMADTVHNGY